MTLEEIRKEWINLNGKVIQACRMKSNRTLTWDEYLAAGGKRIEELRVMWNRLSPEVIIYKGKP